MNLQSRFPVFTTVYCIVYVVVYQLKAHTGLYYPRLGEFHWTDLGPGVGRSPLMMWYGWVLVSAVAGLVAALIVPSRVAQRFWALSWVLPGLLLIFILVHESHYFIG
jgi:hypothetical protein